MSREIVETIDIAATAERVFTALTDPTQLVAWWGDSNVCPATSWELDPKRGGRWISRWRRLDTGAEFALGGQIIAIDPPRVLEYTWWDDRFPNVAHTRVRYDLTDIAGGVRVRLCHSGFDDVRPDYSDYLNGGWWRVLASLRDHVQSAPRFRANTDIAVEVEDVAKAERFYVGTLGFRMRSRGEAFVEVDAGAFRLWISRAGDGARSFIPSLDVPNVAHARESLLASGCRVVRDAPDGSGFHFIDPFGFQIDVIGKPSAVKP